MGVGTGVTGGLWLVQECGHQQGTLRGLGHSGAEDKRTKGQKGRSGECEVTWGHQQDPGRGGAGAGWAWGQPGEHQGLGVGTQGDLVAGKEGSPESRVAPGGQPGSPVCPGGAVPHCAQARGSRTTLGGTLPGGAAPPTPHPRYLGTRRARAGGRPRSGARRARGRRCGTRRPWRLLPAPPTAPATGRGPAACHRHRHHRRDAHN